MPYIRNEMINGNNLCAVVIQKWKWWIFSWDRDDKAIAHSQLYLAPFPLLWDPGHTLVMREIQWYASLDILCSFNWNHQARMLCLFSLFVPISTFKERHCTVWTFWKINIWQNNNAPVLFTDLTLMNVYQKNRATFSWCWLNVYCAYMPEFSFMQM